MLDLRSVNANRQDPQTIKSINYTGILTSNFFIEGQYSERQLIIGKGSGGVPDLIQGTLIRTENQSFRYWAPTFCGSCEDEHRDNKNYLAKGSYFLSTESTGTHDFVFGYDSFDDKRFAINHQTGSDFTVYGSDIVGGVANPAVDPTTGSPYPVFDPNAATPPEILWFAVFNLDLARPTQFKTNSYYVNDRWQLNDKWSFNLGARYDKNDGADGSGAKVANDSKVAPGWARATISTPMATWCSTPATPPMWRRWPTPSPTSRPAAAPSATSSGSMPVRRSTSAAPRASTACRPTRSSARSSLVLLAGRRLQPQQPRPQRADQPVHRGHHHPRRHHPDPRRHQVASATEYALGFTKRLGTRGLVRADLIYRDWTDFYGQQTTLATGQIPTSNGPADVTLVGNFAPGISRTYKGIHTQFRYRLTDKLNIAANYTLSQTEGNFDGETGPSGPITATTDSSPSTASGAGTFPAVTCGWTPGTNCMRGRSTTSSTPSTRS